MIPSKAFSGDKTKVNPKGLPVVKFASENKNDDISIITNELELFGTTPWKKFQFVSYSQSERQTVCWLNQEDMISDNCGHNFFWGEVLCDVKHHVYDEEYEKRHGPTIIITFTWTENSQWLRIKPRSPDLFEFSTDQKG